MYKLFSGKLFVGFGAVLVEKSAKGEYLFCMAFLYVRVCAYRQINIYICVYVITGRLWSDIYIFSLCVWFLCLLGCRQADSARVTGWMDCKEFSYFFLLWCKRVCFFVASEYLNARTLIKIENINFQLPSNLSMLKFNSLQRRTRQRVTCGNVWQRVVCAFKL